MKCSECRFWSSLIAEADGCRVLCALCLNEESPNSQKMTTGTVSCDYGKSNEYGAIDDPSGIWKLYPEHQQIINNQMMPKKKKIILTFKMEIDASRATGVEFKDIKNNTQGFGESICEEMSDGDEVKVTLLSAKVEEG